MSHTLQVVILAAGKGTRMKSDQAKVLHLVGGRPMLRWVIDAALQLAPDRVVVVVGHQAEHVAQVIGSEVDYVVQHPQLGTGHALQIAMPSLHEEGEVLVVCGDMPLLRGETLSQLCAVRRRSMAAAALLTSRIDPPPAFGRIVRDPQGAFDCIVEDRDCTPPQRALTEVNVGVYCFLLAPLKQALQRLDTDNAQGELYLTDALAHLRQAGQGVVTTELRDLDQALGINDPAALAHANALMDTRS